MEELKKSLRQKIIKLADNSEAGWLAVKEYRTEELAQGRALTQKKQNAFKRAEKAKNSNASRYRTGDDRELCRGMFTALFYFQRGRQVFYLFLPYSPCLFLCVSVLEKEIFFLRANVVREKEMPFLEV